MKKQAVLIASLTGVVILGGCSQGKFCCSEGNPQPVAAHQKLIVPETSATTVDQKSELMKISGIGYGAESTFGAYTAGQRRLMAIRASKLDAYRALAEQLYGIQINSNTAVSTLTAKNDSFRARVNAVVRGARMVSVTPMADNNYETVLEVYVDKRFFEETFVYSSTNKSRAVEPEAAYTITSY
jgi:hypothetical protein